MYTLRLFKCDCKTNPKYYYRKKKLDIRKKFYVFRLSFLKLYWKRYWNKNYKNCSKTDLRRPTFQMRKVVFCFRYSNMNYWASLSALIRREGGSLSHNPLKCSSSSRTTDWPWTLTLAFGSYVATSQFLAIVESTTCEYLRYMLI